MNILKGKKNLILTIFLDTFICIIACIIFFLYLINKTIKVSSSNFSNLNNSSTENILIAELDVEFPKNEEVAEIVTDEKATDKELKEEKVSKKDEKKSTSPYFIKVNYTANVVTIYKKDKNNKYTIPYKAMICSTGTYTPKSGIYKTSSKHRWGKLIHDVYGQYATRIVGSILFHSVPYSSNSADTLLYNEYDKLGTTASAGCIRLTVKDCKWIYDNCPSGTMVEFYADSNAGPLGKPSAKKISSIEECRNWDPTDPTSNNPWHTYKPEEIPSIQTNTVTNNTINNNIINENSSNSVINNTVIQNSIISNNITDTNSISNNMSNSIISNNIIIDTNNTIDSNNNINNAFTENTIQNNNSTTENNSAPNNVVNKSHTVSNNNNTGINNLIVNNII